MSSAHDLTTLAGMYRCMVTIREFERRASLLYRNGEIPGFLHLSTGQEAVAVGVSAGLEPHDILTSHHRGHGHSIARGVDTRGMFAELMARATGTCGGLGGSMHIADPAHGVFGANGIVGAGMPIATGAAFAAQRSGGSHAAGQAVVAFFGDGAVTQGVFHESLNLAAVWKLPLIFVCENNFYSEFTPFTAMHPVGVLERGKAYGVRSVAVEGNDVQAVARLIAELRGDIVAGAGPVLVEATTYRWHGHYEGDPQRYRTPEEIQEWKERDPLTIAASSLLATGESTAEEIAAIAIEVERVLDEEIDAVRGDPPPTMQSATAAIGPVLVAGGEERELEDEFRYMDGLREALQREMEDDDATFVAGIDVAAGGGVFGITRDLAAAYPDRVRDTPISESAIIGLGIGSAMAGLRPVVEIMYLDFVGVCFDQLMNQAAKIRFMTGGKVDVPLTIRTQFGAGRSSGAQHSQSLEALLAHVPGLVVVMPSTPADAYRLLRASIRHDGPVVFIENRHLYGRKGGRPAPDEVGTLGRARVVRTGEDVTIVSWSRMVHDCLAAADALAARGINCEVIDLRTISPLDKQTVLGSLAKTNRLLVAHEAVQDFGVGAELAALAVSEGFWSLDAPVRRVAAPPMPAPYAPSLEAVWLPDQDRIEQAVVSLVDEGPLALLSPAETPA